MDSWTLQGDSYSFLRSAPRTFSMCHRDGTPNHVEIFDIINTPSQRSAISETTCLCDIFGDDCETPSLSSSPASAAFAPPQTEAEVRAAVSPLADDLNDSSGSYHTAHSSSEGEEGLEDPSEKHNCPELKSEGQELILTPPDLPTESCIAYNNISPVPQERTASSASEHHSTVCEERFAFVGDKTPQTLSPEGSCQSLSSSLIDTRCSPSPANQIQPDSEVETRSTTPASKDRHSSLSHQTPSPEPRNCVSSASSPSITTQPELEVSPEPESICNQNTRPSPEPPLNNLLVNFPSSTFEPSVIASSTDTQSSSPCPELGGRVSLPDLFTRGFTPDSADHPQTPEFNSSLESTKKDTSVPANQDTGLLVETVNTVSTSSPQYTPSPPVNSLASSPEPRRQSVSPENRPITLSPLPNLVCTASPAKTVTRSPSPAFSLQEKYIFTQSESRTSVNSPAVSYSLSPSPGYSPVVCIDKAASPEIRITASSPEFENKSESPIPELHSDITRELTSSPHITRISYSVVQPEDRVSPAFHELCCLSTPETNRLSGSLNSTSKNTCTPRDLPQILFYPSSEQQPQAQDKTPSPEPQHHSPSPEPRNQTPSSELCQSVSPHHSSRNLSPASPSLDQRISSSPEIPSVEYSVDSTFKATPEADSVFSPAVITEVESCTKPASLFELESQEKSVETKIKRELLVTPSHSPSSSFLASKETTEVTNTKKKPLSVDQLSLDYCSDRQDTDHKYFEERALDKTSPTEIKYPIPGHISPVQDKNKDILPVHKINIPIQSLENPQPCFTYSQTPKSTSSFNSNFTPKPFKRQLSGTVGSENKTPLKDNMASHVNKRRTPSPPLTRFTPVHIIAPEKPYRQWQTRGRSPPQVKTSSPSVNLKKVVTNTEIPHVDPVNNSQDDWFRKGRQLEMERELQLQEERAIDQEQQRDSGMYGERKREEHVPEKGEGWNRDASYREEQVELSFNAKNRKGPVSRNTAPTSRETRPGLPAAHSYSESLLATRQPMQQQSLHRLSSQHDSKGGGHSRRLQPPKTQHKSTAPGRVATNRPGRSSSSSMGSELDEADHEVKWFTDVAFRSLSSPEVDYLDMYNSSHRSSTNISQPSTQESPAVVNAPWLAYADFRGSAQMLDNSEFQQSSAYYSDGLDPSRCYELGSFECVDVAVEKEDSRKVRRGVPKRQIQLKRKDTTESSENSSPGIPVMDSFCQENHSKETLIRQDSIPAAMQDCEPYECSTEIDKQQNDTKAKLQKSASFDESCSKTKIATCLIKSVLTKKMQSDEVAGEEEMHDFDESIPGTNTMVVPPNKSPKAEAVQILSSSLQSDCSLSSDALGARSELHTKDKVERQKNFGGKFNNRPSSTNSNRSVTFSQADSGDAEPQIRNAAALQSEIKVPFDSKQSRAEEQHDDSKTWEETVDDDSANTTACNTGPTGVTCTGHLMMTNRERECENTNSHKQAQQGVQSPCGSKNPDSLLTSSIEKKKASLNVCLTPEAESKMFTSVDKMETMETCVDSKIEEEEVNDKVKGPIHKVRDVRRLVKNTYNLSFKAASAVIPSDESDGILNNEQWKQTRNEYRGELPQEDSNMKQEVRHESQEFKEGMRAEQMIEKKDESSSPAQQQEKTVCRSQPMQIEYKAVCWKEDKSKLSHTPKDLKNVVNKPQPEIDASSQKIHNANTEDGATVDAQSKDNVNMSAEKHITVTHPPKASDNDDKPVVARTDRPMLGSLPKMPSKEREVSTAVVLIRDSTSRTKRAASPSQEEFPITVPASSPSPGLCSTPGSSGHSVSMLLKEKGYQADIGAVVGDGQNAGGSKSAPSKHVNCLEIPLQTTMAAESHRDRTFSSSSTSTPAAMSGNTEDNANTGKEEGATIKPESTKKISQSPPKTTEEPTPPATKQDAQGDFEAVKRLDPTFPLRSPAIRRFKPQPIEVKALSKEMNKEDTTAGSSGNSRPQAIEVKSIAKNTQKPIVPPKPSCKFKPVDSGTMPSETQRLPLTAAKPHSEDRTQTIVVSSPTIYRKIPNDSTSNYTRKVAVSAVSSLKPPPSKPIPTSNFSTQPSTSEAEAPADRPMHQQPGASPHSSRYAQRPPPAPVTTSGPTFYSATLSDATGHQPQAPAPTGATQTIQPAVTDSHIQLPDLRMAYPHEQATMGASNNAQPAPVSTAQGLGYMRHPYRRSLSSECTQRRDDLHFYASDDPPSYDERESFSPLRLPDLPPRSNRYQPSSRPPPCSCTTGCPSHPGPPHPHSHNSPHNLTPPAPTHSPGQTLHYPVSQPPLRPHHCRPDPQPVTHQPSSPKSSPLGPGPPQGLYQPLHQPPLCPPHPSLMHAYPAERPMQPSQHADPRRPPVHRSPQQHPPVITGAPYSDPSHSHSPGLPHIDPHYLCGPQSLGPSYGSEYGGDSSSLYSESGYGQTPRRVLMDPETGKYFYIEVPVQPLRKMLFDPETGQYVEVLIPQQAMSHSGLYPPSAPNYPSLHNTNMYASAPQYMPYAAPPAHPQPPRYAEGSAAVSIHPHGPGVGYRNPSGQGSKPEAQGHPPVDQNYLESMYYVPTGMNASPNPTPPDYYHKHPPNLPPTGGKRS